MRDFLLSDAELAVLDDLCHVLNSEQLATDANEVKRMYAYIESIGYSDTTKVIETIFDNDDFDWHSTVRQLLSNCTPEQLSYLVHKHSDGGNHYGDDLIEAMYDDIIVVPFEAAIDLYDKPKLLLGVHWAITFECFFNEAKINAAYDLWLIPSALHVNDEGEYPSLIDYIDKLTSFSNAGWVID